MAVHVFSDESGDFGKCACFLIGMVIAPRHELIEGKIATLRAEKKYHRELKYSSTDKHKVSFAKAVIDLFMDEPELDFRCIVKAKAHHDMAHYAKVGRPSIADMAGEDVAYNYSYRELLTNNGLTEPFVLKIDQRDLAKRNNLPGYLVAEVQPLLDVHPHDSHEFGLLQMTDLLTGCVFGDCTNIQHPVKREVLEYLKARLGVPSLTVKHPWRLRTKFNIWHWRPRRR